MLGGDYLTAHNPETGEEYWRFCYSPNIRSSGALSRRPWWPTA
jgi:outer membrane protein assembly factor BamB